MAEAIQEGVRTMDGSFEEMLEADTNAHRISDALRRNNPLPPGPALVPVARYTDRAYHELEKEKLWGRAWQVACHEDDFEQVGDVVPYDIADKSYLVVKVAEDEFKAYFSRSIIPYGMFIQV